MEVDLIANLSWAPKLKHDGRRDRLTMAGTQLFHPTCNGTQGTLPFARRIVALFTVLASLGLAAPGKASAQEARATYQVKAALLFNLLKFVEWPGDAPADPHAKWVIGFVGDSPINVQMAYLFEGRKVLGRDLEVKRFQAADNLRNCNILFISASERKRLPSIFEALRGSSVLTVADMDHFVDSGGMVQFVVEEDRVRLTIDASATSHARLKISSKLLSLARVVARAEHE